MDANIPETTGEVLDRKLRVILQEATRETVLSATARVVELGFDAQTAFRVVSAAIDNGPGHQLRFTNKEK